MMRGTAKTFRPLSALGALCLAGAALTAQERTLALRGATVHTGAGRVIDDGVVVLAGGRIQTVGEAGTAIPDGAEVLDIGGRVVTPGLIDAGATYGVPDDDANEQGGEVTPHMRILDAVDPADDGFRRALRQGVTAVHLTPGNRNVIGGLGAVLRTHGATVAEMLVRDETGLRLALGSEPSRGNRAIRGGTPSSMYYRRPTTRMGVVWKVRKAFYDAQEYAQRTVDPENATAADPGLEVLVRALNRKLLVHTTARAEQDIRTALRLAEEFGYQPVLDEAVEAWRVPDEIAKAGVTVLFGAPSATDIAGSGSRDGTEVRLHTLVLLAERGVPFAIQTGSHPGALSLVREATFAVRHGLSPEQALEAITAVPARVLKVDDRIGTLEPGKDADLVLWSGAPFDPTSRVEAVYIGGERVHG